MEDDRIDLERFASTAYREISLAEHQLSITPRKVLAELESEIRIKEADAAHQRNKDLLLLRITSAAVIAVIGLCIWIVIAKGLSAEDGKLAFGALISIVSALVGYFTGKSSK